MCRCHPESSHLHIFNAHKLLSQEPFVVSQFVCRWVNIRANTNSKTKKMKGLHSHGSWAELIFVSGRGFAYCFKRTPFAIITELWKTAHDGATKTLMCPHCGNWLQYANTICSPFMHTVWVLKVLKPIPINGMGRMNCYRRPSKLPPRFVKMTFFNVTEKCCYFLMTSVNFPAKYHF